MPVQLCSVLYYKGDIDMISATDNGYGDAVTHCIVVPPIYIYDSRFRLVYFFSVSFHRRDLR